MNTLPSITLDYLYKTLLFCFIISPNAPWYHQLLIWAIRIFTISLLLRTYIVPWALARISNHIRIRSISLRSLRGLYVKTGSRTWRVDRIAFRWSYKERMNRFGIMVDGLRLEIEGGGVQRTAPRTRRHKRGLTLADFAPSPMARRAWSVVHKVYALVDPFLRPATRVLVAVCLRQIIRWLPHIAQRLTFDLKSAVVTFKDLPGTQLGAETIHGQFNLAFSNLDNVPEDVAEQATIRRQPSRLYNMASWKNGLTESLRRSWDRAWGRTEGTVSLSLEISKVTGHGVSPTAGSQGRRFIEFPGLIGVQSSLRFSPKTGTLDPKSLRSSLAIGECYVAVDVLRSLLDLYKAQRPSCPVPQDGVDSDPMSPLSDGPEPSATLSPSSAEFRSPPVTPGSPFFEAISASMRSRLRPRRPVSKVSKVAAKSTLSILESFAVHVATIRLVSQPLNDLGVLDRTYEGLVHDLAIKIKLSEPSDPLHGQWLGRSKASDQLSSDSYALELNLTKISFDRYVSGSNLRLLTMGPVSLGILAHQWPTPWLANSRFLCGDPNAPFVAVHLKLDSLRLTERIEFLNEIVNRPKIPLAPSPPIYPISPQKSIPRVVVQVHCGSITARLLCGSQRSSAPRAIELRSSSLAANLTSEFIHIPYTTTIAKGGLQLQLVPPSLPLQMNIEFSAAVAPILVRIRNLGLPQTAPLRVDGVGTSDPTFLEDPAVISLETIEFVAQAKLQGDLDDISGSVPSMSLETTLIDLHCFTDTIAIELWHPTVLAVVSQLSSQLSPRRSPDLPHLTIPISLLDRLPVGISTTTSCARFMVFMTSPELNRKDELDLSRGCALRAGLRFQYCFLQPAQLGYFKGILKSSQTRHKLYLPEEHIREALATARTASVTGISSAFFKTLVVNLALRTAVASPFSPDDPLIVERDNPDLAKYEFLKMKSILVEAKVMGRRYPAHPPSDSCDVTITIPDIRGEFQMCNVYSALLAGRTLRGLLPRSSRRSRTSSSTKLALQLSCDVKAIHWMWNLPKQKVVTRLDGLSARGSLGGPVTVRLTRCRVYVQLPGPNLTRPMPGEEERWVELGALQGWDLFLPQPTAKAMRMSVNGDSVRVRLPHSYVLADLILDISVAAKAARHLVKVLPTGRFTSMPKPEAEGPKSVPNISMRVRCICVEVADDPFESKLAVISKASREACRFREEREKAFRLKVATILGLGTEEPITLGNIGVGNDYQFTPEHSTSIEDARQRLDHLHAFDWIFRHRTAKEAQARSEEAVLRAVVGQFPESSRGSHNLINPEPTALEPPVLRLILDDVALDITPPSFPSDSLPEFLSQMGAGLPKDTQFFLLVPLHINLHLSSLRATLRDYPMPLLNIARFSGESAKAVTFETDLVIAEETGSNSSVEWVDCPIIPRDYGISGAAPLSISVPKTIMPVKTYAEPVLQVATQNITTVSWGVSYMPVLQDLTRIVDTLTSAPRDTSPGIGFWDKLRLVMHWKLKASFKGDIHVHLKGLRDPYDTSGNGAGFILACHGNPKVLVGYPNESNELIQIISDSLTAAIPTQETLHSAARTSSPLPGSNDISHFRKVCAKLSSGVRLGIGFLMERSCGPECLVCSGSPFHRRCRIFSFRPHYDVKLEKKVAVPERKASDDSYNGFRSDFIHMSLSLAASTRANMVHGIRKNAPNSFHLTPRVFAHFWSWLALFDNTLSLPIRQGSLYPRRIVSPKFGKHLATLKYRILVPQLFFLHAYMDDSRETWVDGVTPFIGIKGMVDDVQIDMHQRDQETLVPGTGVGVGKTKRIRHKALYAAEVVLKGLDLRAILATFVDPLKQSVPVTCPPERSSYRTRNKLPIVDPSSSWIDRDDFTEVDWSPTVEPEVNILPLMTCPRFNYLKRNPPSADIHVEQSKFGSEASHTCMLGKDLPSAQIQIELAKARIAELKKLSFMTSEPAIDLDETPLQDRTHTQKMINLLEEYIRHLHDAPSSPEDEHYFFPSEQISSDEWAMFNNVYQIHSPKIFMSSAIRDIMIQYYNCSRQRRGFEYHIATRAVRFILDQAAATASANVQKDSAKPRGAFHPGQAAASALRKILSGDNAKSSIEVSDLPTHLDIVDPLAGWSDAVSLSKSHFCQLLKPQIILRSNEKATESICILAAVQAKLQSFNIMDKSNADDPISGKVMSRSYGSLTGLQAFSPVNAAQYRDGGVPLEVLVDFRCESDAFDRLVPQTDATIRYDKFNRLRLRNNVTSVSRVDSKDSSKVADNHLQNQTDLVQVNIPRFTVTASEQHFQTIADIVTNVILFSDAAHKTRLDKLETLLFTYDFTDLISASNVISDVQSRLRSAVEIERLALAQSGIRETDIELLKLKAHIYLLAEELTFLFDAIKMAQDRMDDSSDQKSALLLHASSSEISWRMLDEFKGLLAKLAVRNINFYWLSRQDSSTVNNLAVGDLQAFDGSRNAMWTEILCKYDEPPNHPLLKRGLFLLAHWIVLAPVGGITIYEEFHINFHPLRVQIDADLGRRMMEYFWPARRNRGKGTSSSPTEENRGADATVRASLDSPRALQDGAFAAEQGSPNLKPPAVLRRLGPSRSFTDLRSTAASSSLAVSKLQRRGSSDALNVNANSSANEGRAVKPRQARRQTFGDAAEMKTRSSQKSFVLVQVASLHVLLSVKKDDSFECRDARIRTRDLEYRNQTWSFEELVNQFIPSDMSWKGWVKMAFHQPLLPVFPVARELISKTKWLSPSKNNHADSQNFISRFGKTNLASNGETRVSRGRTKESRTPSPQRKWKRTSRRRPDTPPTSFNITPLTAEPDSLESELSLVEAKQSHRGRVRSLFSRANSRSRKSVESSPANSKNPIPLPPETEGRPSASTNSSQDHHLDPPRRSSSMHP
ncbi:hypothetical protein HGRIS_009489 [Hohenbuehelia grisea]|uniref:Golgi-body localization protein domain-containing protein n=1 Tax=Hohenbuehelia grisea TaxID=104357 RepID=A0ABR3J1C5_9AGAR